MGPLGLCLRATDLPVCLLITATRLHRFGSLSQLPLWSLLFGFNPWELNGGLGVVTC